MFVYKLGEHWLPDIILETKFALFWVIVISSFWVEPKVRNAQDFLHLLLFNGVFGLSLFWVLALNQGLKALTEDGVLLLQVLLCAYACSWLARLILITVVSTLRHADGLPSRVLARSSLIVSTLVVSWFLFDRLVELLSQRAFALKRIHVKHIMLRVAVLLELWLAFLVYRVDIELKLL